MSEPVTPADFRRGLLAHMAGDTAAAEAAYRRAMQSPPLFGPAQFHLIRLLEAAHRWADALAERRVAFARNPGSASARMELALALLGQGAYAEAWPHYEARMAFGPGKLRPDLPFPEWDGGPVTSLLVWDEQGFGDAIQFARFVPPLAERGVRVSAVVREPLVRLFASLGVEVLTARQNVRVPVSDAWAMLGSLPGRLGVTLETLPAPAAYLAPPDAARRAWAGKLGAGARVGVVTQSGSGAGTNPQRSLSPEASGFLLSLPGAVDLRPETSPLPIADFADTAALMAQLDLVITVDTAAAHLAGALGRPCWLLLPHWGVDWRWLRDGRTDSPWYPSLRLYRQPAEGDWATPLKAIAQDLSGFFRPAG